MVVHGGGVVWSCMRVVRGEGMLWPCMGVVWWYMGVGWGAWGWCGRAWGRCGVTFNFPLIPSAHPPGPNAPVVSISIMPRAPSGTEKKNPPFPPHPTALPRHTGPVTATSSVLQPTAPPPVSVHQRLVGSNHIAPEPHLEHDVREAALPFGVVSSALEPEQPSLPSFGRFPAKNHRDRIIVIKGRKAT